MNKDETIAKLVNGVREKPDDPEAHFSLGVYLLDSGNFQESVDAFMRVLRLAPENGRAYVTLGRAYMKMKRVQEAINAYMGALRLLPDSIESYLLLGQAYMDDGSHEKAIETLNMAKRLKPDEPMIHFRLGMYLYEAEKVVEARESYLEAIRLKPDFAQAHNNLGMLYLDCGYTLMAGKSFAKAVDADSDNPVYYDNFGRAQAGLLNYDKALELQLKSIRINPKRAATHRHIADTYFRMEEKALALKASRQAVALDGDDPDNCLFLAEICAFTDNREESLKLCREYLKRWPDNINVLSRVATIYMHTRATYGGKSTLYFNGLEKAEELLKKALKLSPNNVSLHKKMVTVIQSQGWGGKYTERAINHLAEIVRIRPDDPKSHFELGKLYCDDWDYRDLGRLPEAEICFRKAIRLNPKMIEAYEYLSKTYEKLGWEQLAKDAMKKAEELSENK